LITVHRQKNFYLRLTAIILRHPQPASRTAYYSGWQRPSQTFSAAGTNKFHLQKPLLFLFHSATSRLNMTINYTTLLLARKANGRQFIPKGQSFFRQNVVK